MINLETRNASLEDLAALLKQQDILKADAIVPATSIRSQGGILYVEGMGSRFEADTVEAALAGGSSQGVGVFRPTAIMDGQIAEKLGVPVQYLRKLREQRPDLYDANVNGWLHGRFHTDEEGRIVSGPDPDRRKFLLRTFADPDGGEGVGRALLSNSYKPIDNLDAIVAALQGVRQAGRTVEVVDCDLTENRMVVRVACPDFAVMAPTLLENYRPQAGGWTVESARRAASREYPGSVEPGREPVVFAGFEISNGETGGSAFQIVPRALVLMCKNGLKFDVASTLRMVHLGAKLDEGAIRWSDATYRKNLEIVSSMAADAVTTYLDRDWLVEQVQAVEAKAGVELPEPKATVEHIGKTLKFSQETIDGVLDHFIKGSQPTAGGILNAITSYAQSDKLTADQAYELENVALQAFNIAAKV